MRAVSFSRLRRAAHQPGAGEYQPLEPDAGLGMVGVFGYGENEADATVGVLECGYRTAVQSHGVFDDGEAETCASEFAASTFVDTVESLEDTR